MKEYNFTSREAGLACHVIELFRDSHYEYYVSTDYYADLLFAFGVRDQFTENELYTLFRRGYFDDIIRRASMED